MFGWHDLKVEERVDEINEIDKKLSNDVNEEVKEMVNRRNKTISSMWSQLDIKDNMLIQNSIVNWIREGNQNSQIFHKVIKGRARRRFIGAVQTENGVVHSVEDVKEEVWKFFYHKYWEPIMDRPIFVGVSTSPLSSFDVNFLDVSFTAEEVKAVMGYDGSKSSGPDDFNFVFIKNCCEFLKDDIVVFVQGFHRNPIM